jgi:hypothetical protein
MAKWALRTTATRYASRSRLTLRGLRDLTGETVAVLLAESVPTAPLRAIALPLLRGAARVVVRPSRRQREFAAFVARELAQQCGLPVDLAATEDPRAFLAEMVARGVHTVIAYGADETLRAIQAALPESVWFEGRGHGFGVAVVLAETCENEFEVFDTSLALGADVAAYDQRGCLSPQVVLVEGTLDEAGLFGEQLLGALQLYGRERPRGTIDVGLAAEIVQWQGVMAARAVAFWRGEDHAVAVLEEKELVGSPGGRNIAVVPCGSLEGVARLLEPVAGHLTTIGIAGPEARWRELALPPGACPRIVSVGAMQNPPLDGYEDPRPPAFGPRGSAPRRPT